MPDRSDTNAISVVPQYSVVIPVFNAAETLSELIARLTSVFESKTSNYEIILVDDASPDNSWKVMRALRDKDRRVKIIRHMKNFGQHKAILCGLHCAKGDVIVTMDDDLQHPPEEIPNLLAALSGEEGADVAIGVYDVKRHSGFRNAGSRIVQAVTARILSRGTEVRLGSFRAMKREVVRELLAIRTHAPRVSPMLLQITDRIKNVRVRHEPRKVGRSGYNLRRLVSDSLDNILSHSALPLQVVSGIGFGSSLLSFAMSIHYLLKYLLVGISVRGWTSTILLLLFFFGVLLFSLGIVGEYLVRILREVQGTPRSIIREKEI
jgi:polyisoprenyl-phosphate glycosyltransferase